MPSGTELVGGRIPGEQIDHDEIIADSATFTNAAEVELVTITVPVVVGRTYRIWGNLGMQSTVANDVVQVRLREDTIAGTNLDSSEILIPRTSTTAKVPVIIESLYLADATENKVLVIGGTRLAGTGTCRIEAASTRKSHFRVTYEIG